ncbi:hypothetical protein V8E53_007510 [Lactarius tabidus]
MAGQHRFLSLPNQSVSGRVVRKDRQVMQVGVGKTGSSPVSRPPVPRIMQTTSDPSHDYSIRRLHCEELERDVGRWFGPSTAAGANRYLVQSFPDPSLGISVALEGQIFQTNVYPSSHPPTQSHRRHMLSRWGGRAVVVVWLGIDAVNPIC